MESTISKTIIVFCAFTKYPIQMKIETNDIVERFDCRAPQAQWWPLPTQMVDGEAATLPLMMIQWR